MTTTAPHPTEGLINDGSARTRTHKHMHAHAYTRTHAPQTHATTAAPEIRPGRREMSQRAHVDRSVDDDKERDMPVTLGNLG